MAAETDLYEDDFIGWTEQQAKALREAARQPTNLGLDWEHLAEEIADLGKDWRRAVATQVRLVIEHLLKLECSPAAEPRRGWIEAVGRARAEIELWLACEPAMRRRLTGIIEQEWPRAAKIAVKSFQGYGENLAPLQGRLHDGRYPDEQIIGDWYP